MQKSTKTCAETTKLHPSGLTWERWYWPWKTPMERKQIQEWMMKKDNHGLDQSIPF